MTQESFSQRSLEPVAAPLYGLRVFGIDDGYVHKVTAPEVWEQKRPLVRMSIPENGGLVSTPRLGAIRSVFRTAWVWGAGVNHAKCLAGATTIGSPAEPHTDGQRIDLECACGFWAYTNGAHTMPVRGFVCLGVIEAWGQTIIGPAGFRAEHARIKGICFSLDTPLAAHTKTPPDTLVVATGSTGDIIRGLLRATIRLLLTRGKPPPNGPETSVQFALKSTCPDDLQEIVRENYPDIQIFDNVTDMLAAYPTSDLRPLLPEEQPPQEGETE